MVDKTGLSGLYSFDLNFSIAESDEKPPIWTALEDQLGLKLESGKASIDQPSAHASSARNRTNTTACFVPANQTQPE